MEHLNDQDKKEMMIYEALKTVIDPELGISIIDMGLVYHISYEESQVNIVMTLSSKGCPMGELILNNVEDTIKELLPEVKTDIRLVWEPAWNSAFITPAGRQALENR